MMWLRLFRESLGFAWSAIVINKLRTFLSLLGVMVGIFVISAVFAVVDSMEDNLMEQDMERHHKVYHTGSLEQNN